MPDRSLQQSRSTALQRTEKFADQTARARHEAAVIAKGHADIDAGNGIEDDDLETWLDQLEHDEATPMPPPRNPASRR